MGLIFNAKTEEVSIYGVKYVDSPIYVRPVNISIDTNLSLCSFWLEGRKKDIHGELEFREQYTIEIDKKKDVFAQIYSFTKTIDKYRLSEDI